ncbi:hypothetical protein ABLO27_18715 [Roseibium sp. SCPC15]
MKVELALLALTSGFRITRWLLRATLSGMTEGGAGHAPFTFHTVIPDQ